MLITFLIHENPYDNKHCRMIEHDWETVHKSEYFPNKNRVTAIKYQTKQFRSVAFAAEPIWHYEPGTYGNRYWGR